MASTCDMSATEVWFGNSFNPRTAPVEQLGTFIFATAAVLSAWSTGSFAQMMSTIIPGRDYHSYANVQQFQVKSFVLELKVA